MANGRQNILKNTAENIFSSRLEALNLARQPLFSQAMAWFQPSEPWSNIEF
jgi:hypothetical protein